MSDSSWPFYESVVSELIELVRAGQMTEETFTGLATLMGSLSWWNARTRELQTLLAGSLNYGSNVLTLEQILEPWFISALESQREAISMPLSHSGCWCNSYRRRATSD